MVKMQLVVVTQVMVVYVVKMHPVVKTLFLGLFGCCEVFGDLVWSWRRQETKIGKNLKKISDRGLRICPALVTKSGVKPHLFPATNIFSGTAPTRPRTTQKGLKTIYKDN